MGDRWVHGTTLGGAGPMRRRRCSSGAWPTPAPPMPACSGRWTCSQVPKRAKRSPGSKANFARWSSTTRPWDENGDRRRPPW